MKMCWPGEMRSSELIITFILTPVRNSGVAASTLFHSRLPFKDV